MEALEIYQFDDFEVDPGSRSVRRGGETIVLSRRAFDVLLYFVRNPNKVISKEELLRNIWPDAFVDENNLAQSISVLRKAMGEKPGTSGYILTLPGRGYQFICPVRSNALDVRVPESQQRVANSVLYEEHTVRTSIVTEQEEFIKVRNRRVGFWSTMVAGGLALLGGTGILLWRHTHRVPPDPIVVLANMENTTGDPGLGDVMNTAVATDLKQSPYLNFLSMVHVQETLTQMQQKKNSPLTPDLAREVCLRNNAQIMLRGVVAKLGQKYLLTLDATDCISGDLLATSKAEAGMGDEIPHAIDLIAADIRKKLGESRASIQRFDTPLIPERTGSLEALRNYSSAIHLEVAGKNSDAIPLFKRAIELDPKFAIAYADLATAYGNTGNLVDKNANLTRAYKLRDFADERNRLFIVAIYHENVTGNLEEALQNYRNWAEIYPGNPAAWGNMASIYTDLGHAELAIPLARRALSMNPKIAVGYIILSRALMYAGQFEEAKSVCEQAIAKGIDGVDLHSQLMQIDVARSDAEGVRAQIDWGKSHDFAGRLRLNEAFLALAEGRVLQGQEILRELSSIYKKEGATEQYVVHLLRSSRVLAETGHLQEARTLLHSQVLPDDAPDPLVTMAETGELRRAERELSRELAMHAEDTLWTGLGGPQIRAALLIAQHNPKEAVIALQSASPYELSTLEVPYMRGTAYLEAKQPAAAEKEFRKVIAHRGVDPLSHDYPLAYLGLARALAQEAKATESRDAYQSFLKYWKDADPEEPLVRQAHMELGEVASGKH